MKKISAFLIAFLCACSAFADITLRQSTATEEAMGPFVSNTDGYTPSTGLTIAQADVRLKKNGGSWAQKNDATSCTHEENGWYECPLNTTDTNTVGELVVAIYKTGALPVSRTYQIVNTAVYDRDNASAGTGYITNAPVNVAQFGGSNGTFASGIPAVNTTQLNGTSQTARDIGASVLLSSGTGTGQLSFTSGVVSANATQIGGQTASASGTVTFPNATLASTTNITAGTITTATTATNVTTLSSGAISEASYATTTGSVAPLGIGRQGPAQSATGSTVTLDAAAAYPDNNLQGGTLFVLGSTQGYWQSATIASNVGSTDVVTITPNAGYVTPSGTITYKIFGTAQGSGGGASASDVWTYGTRTVTAATNITSTGVAVPITSSRVDASVGAYQSGLTPLQPTTAGRTLDVSAGGEAGMDWANIGSPTTTVNLSGTTFSTSQAVASVSGAVGSVTGAVGSVTGNVGGNVTGTVASVVGAVGSVTGAVGSVTGAVGSVTGNVGGNVTGTVASVVGAVGSVTGNVGGTVNGLTSTAQGNVRTAVGLATANTDTQLAAIKAVDDAVKVKTDQLNFTVAGQVDSNAESMNANSICGTGASGTPWKGCP